MTRSFAIETSGDQIIIRMERAGIPADRWLSLFERLRIEYLAQKADFNPEAMRLAEEIEEEWWRENRNDFLKGVAE